MKNYTMGVFNTREQAEAAINTLHNDLHVPTDDISYIYKDVLGRTKEVDASDVTDDTAGEKAATGAASGATLGGVIGAGLGLATVAGLIPVIGPIFAAGPLIAALGIGGAVGTTAAGAVTGAAAGGIIGALTNMGLSEPVAKVYQDKVNAGNVLVAVHADDSVDVAHALEHAGATDVNLLAPTLA